MKRNGQEGDPAEVISLLLLDPHLEHLLSSRREYEEVATFVHASRGEVNRALLFQITVPLFVLLVDTHRHLALQKFERISRLVCRFVVAKATRIVSDNEVIIL